MVVVSQKCWRMFLINKTNDTTAMERDYSKLPFINLSKENLRLLYDSLEKDQVGNIMFAIYEHLYLGVIPTFNTKAETAAYNQLMSVVERKAEPYFNMVEGGKKGAAARWDKKEEQQEQQEDMYLGELEDLVGSGKTFNTAQPTKRKEEPKTIEIEQPVVEEPKEKVEYAVPSSLLELCRPFFKERYWLLGYDFERVWRDNSSVKDFAHKHNISKDKLKEAFAAIR